MSGTSTPKHHYSAKQIVKVQRPLVGPSHTCMIYGSGRKNAVEIRISDELHKIMRKKQGMAAHKAFFWATWNSKAKAWDFGDKPQEAPWQDW